MSESEEKEGAAGLPPSWEVGFVREGQPAEVKLEAFPFTRFGTVPGTVRLVSRHAVGGTGSATLPRSEAEARGSAEEGGYRITVGLDRAKMAAEWGGVALRPGMAAQADVVNGKRRVITFLLDPIVRHRLEAGHER